MRYSDEDFWDQVRMEAADAVAEREFDATLVATGYDPKTHMVRGMIMPHEVESGWVQIGAAHVGNGFGVMVGPNVGDPQKLDGDQFTLSYEGGDRNNLVATHRHFSQKAKPPEVQSGEILVRHAEGTKTFINKDGELTHQFMDDGGKIAWTKDKKITIDNSGQSIVIRGQNIDFNPPS